MIDFGKLFAESWYTCIPSGSTEICPALFAASSDWMVIVFDEERISKIFHLHFLCHK